jgi:cation diffusion facilitator family transporter
MPHETSQRSRIRVALVSIAVGALLLAAKYYAYYVSHSAALLADAYENVVNVVAAVFALGAVMFAGKPADREHPYGHGKIEHFSAAFEGGMISLAAVLIWYEAIRALVEGPRPGNLSLGLMVNLGAGACNGLLGLFLILQGRRQRSITLVADGHHVLSDFYTTLGIAGGLLLVRATGLAFLDPILAMAVGLLLARTGFLLVRSSSIALLDTEDPELLKRLVTIIDRIHPPDIMAIHELRTLRSGRYTHVDIHMVLPEFYEILRAHAIAEDFAKRVVEAADIEGELHTHVDPCQRAYCRHCAVSPCPVRQEPCTEERPITLDQAVAPGSI